MTRKEAAFIRQARVGHLATVDEQGQPLNLPFCFAFDGECLYSPIDEKPKTAAPRELKRLRNIRANPRVSVASTATTTKTGPGSPTSSSRARPTS